MTQPRRRKKPGDLARRVGMTIQALREARRWKQADLAGRLGVSQKWVSEIETGVNITLSTLHDFSAALGVEPYVLLLDPISAADESKAGMSARKILGHLEHFDERSRGLVLRVMENLAEYQTAPKT